jgi:Flp pilus assembly secretin CpaC
MVPAMRVLYGDDRVELPKPSPGDAGLVLEMPVGSRRTLTDDRRITHAEAKDSTIVRIEAIESNSVRIRVLRGDETILTLTNEKGRSRDVIVRGTLPIDDPGVRRRGNQLEMVVYRRTILTLDQPAARLQVDHPTIVRVQALSPKEMLVIADSPGAAGLTCWSEPGDIARFDVTVVEDPAGLKESADAGPADSRP